MAAVIDIQTGHRVDHDQISRRPELVLIHGGREMARVYLFRRVLVGVTAVLLLIGVALAGRILLVDRSSEPALTTTHVVVSGETLWSIARAAQPERDPRHTIADIVDENSTDQRRFDPWVPLAVGQEIRVPLDR